MRKNLKLFSGVLIASLISNTTLSSTNFLKAEARSSQHSAVVNNSSDEDKSSTSTNEKDDDTVNEKENSNDTNKDTSSNSSSDDESTNILEALNDDKELKEEDIADLSAPLSYSSDFVDELKVAFPDFKPIRKLSPLYTSYTPYLDVVNNELSYINNPLNLNPEGASIYGDQNTCGILIKEIPKELKEINDLIKEEYNSTVFSLMPTMMVFNDAFNILSIKYNSILESNYKNQVTLNMLLSDLTPQFCSLLQSIKDFKKQLPELIDTLNELVDGQPSSDKDDTEDEDTTNEEVTDENATDEDTTDQEDTDKEDTSNENTTNGNTTTENKPNNNSTESTGTTSGNKNEQTESSNNTSNNTSTEEEQIDPEKVTLYFGEDGQELIYNEEEDKFYEVNPDDPNQEELIEYSGEVSTMTLKDYLAMELYFDSDGNELIYDEEKNEYLIYDADNDEYLVYEGEVTTMTMEDYLKEH